MIGTGSTTPLHTWMAATNARRPTTSDREGKYRGNAVSIRIPNKRALAQWAARCTPSNRKMRDDGLLGVVLSRQGGFHVSDLSVGPVEPSRQPFTG